MSAEHLQSKAGFEEGLLAWRNQTMTAECVIETGVLRCLRSNVNTPVRRQDLHFRLSIVLLTRRLFARGIT